MLSTLINVLIFTHTHGSLKLILRKIIVHIILFTKNAINPKTENSINKNFRVQLCRNQNLEM